MGKAQIYPSVVNSLTANFGPGNSILFIDHADVWMLASSPQQEQNSDSSEGRMPSSSIWVSLHKKKTVIQQ
jgi:hypothetical protein